MVVLHENNIFSLEELMYTIFLCSRKNLYHGNR